jgi:uncharacterized membrane protein YeiB
VEKEFIPNATEIAEHTALMKGSYGQVASFVRDKAADGQFKYLVFAIWDMLALVLLGIALMMAHVSVLMLVYRAGLLRGLFERLRAVGQMAFTNYVIHTVICSLVFFGYGLNRFAEWEYYQLCWLVAGISVLQLIVSPLWLRAFQFGPLEWLWRTLAYGVRPPFLRRPVQPVAPLREPAAG